MSESLYGLDVQLDAKPGKVDEVADFLESAQPMAEAEEDTITWFAYQVDDTKFRIFDTFSDKEARQRHLDGEIASALMEEADDLLASDPKIKEVEILAATHS